VLVGEINSPPDGSLWTVVADLPAPIDSRVVLFAERSDPQGQADLDEACRACRWVVGVELLLPRERLLRSLVAAMRIADAVTPGTPGILDVPSSTWHGRDSLSQWFLPVEADPPEWLLWTAHAATHDREGRPGSPHWIRTSGLWRCGLPELELLEVPTELVRAGISLVHGVAELLLDEPAPRPSATWPIGIGMDVALVPWQDVVPLLPQGSPGSLTSRRMTDTAPPVDTLDHPFGGVRAVICDPVAIGSLRKVWGPPLKALQSIVAGKALLHQSPSAARRAHRLAQRTLPQLLDAFRIAAGLAAESSTPPLFKTLVAAAFDATEGQFIAGSAPQPTSAPKAEDEAGDENGGQIPPHLASNDSQGEAPRPDSCEHLWIEVASIEDGAVRGTLLNDPSNSLALRAGAAVTVPCNAISDWQIIREGVILTPDEAPWVSEAVRDWRRSTESGSGRR